MDNFEKTVRKISSLERQLGRLKVIESGGGETFLATPLTSTSFNGDSFSTTAKTKIDLSSVFGAPAGISAVSVRLRVRDSASSAASYWFGLSPNDIDESFALSLRCPSPNNRWGDGAGIVPCDSSGDIYYQVSASGSNTLDAWLQIWGYWT